MTAPSFEQLEDLAKELALNEGHLFWEALDEVTRNWYRAEAVREMMGQQPPIAGTHLPGDHR
jgi:hypothetical protein